MVVVFELGEAPGVRQLVHHEDAHLVAEFVPVRRVRIVAHAQRVHAEGLGLFEAAADGGSVRD